MGRILDVLRRKRSQLPTSPRSSETCREFPPRVHSDSDHMQDHEIDKENEKPILKGLINNEAICFSPLTLCDERCCRPSTGGRKSEGNLKTLEHGEHDSGEDMNIGFADESHDEPVGLTYPSEVSGNIGIDEITDISDDIALGSISESEHSSEAAAASVSEVTEVSDDGILRDDEGNPIDPNEAEENMLRDDEGNIIDPKTLVLRDSFVDISCESDEYYDDTGEKIDPSELISCIAEQGPIAVTDDSTQSEGEVDYDLDAVLPFEDKLLSPVNKHGPQDDWFKEPSCPLSSRVYQTGRGTTKERRNAVSLRRKRRGQRPSLNGTEEYIHIMFHNQLSTLVEESRTVDSMASSGDEDNETDQTSPSLPRNSKFRSCGTYDERFIRARWEYSLHVMNSKSYPDEALVDACDEINDLLKPATPAPQVDSAAELEIGEI